MSRVRRGPPACHALINPTWWLLCGACRRVRLPRAIRGARCGTGLRWATATPVLVLIACAAVANLGARAMLGHAVPGDFAQEVVAARSVRDGNALYPADVNARGRDVAGAEIRRRCPRGCPVRLRRWLDGAPARRP